MQSSQASKLQKCLIKTFVYSDIFDYPLSVYEAQRFLISDASIAAEVVKKTLKILADSGQIFADGGFYFLKGREKIINLRRKRERWAEDKWEIAQNTANRLKIIPTIKMIGVTGALAMENCQEEDDIDLLIITSRNCLWLTRLLVIILCDLMGIKRRKPNEKNVKNKICFNLFLDEAHLRIEPENLFLAHEICQVKPIFDKGGVYEKFVKDNEWTKKYLPNAIDNSKVKSQNSKIQFKIQNLNLASKIYYYLNKIVFKFQFWYMKPKMTCEKVNLHQAFFHPRDLSDKVQKEFERRIKSLVF